MTSDLQTIKSKIKARISDLHKRGEVVNGKYVYHFVTPEIAELNWVLELFPTKECKLTLTNS